MNTGDSSDSPPLPSSEPMQAYCFPVTGDAVRLVMREGEPWLVARDVCHALEINNPTMALRRLDDDEKMTINSIEGHSGQRGGAQFFNIINESGLYSLIMTSRKPQAKAFRRWVTGEVLPAIRRTGRYETQQALPAPEELLKRAMAGLLDGSVSPQQAEAMHRLYRAHRGEPEVRLSRSKDVEPEAQGGRVFGGRSITSDHPWVRVIAGLAAEGWEGTTTALAAFITARGSATDARQLGRFLAAARPLLLSLGVAVSDRVQIRTDDGDREYRRRIGLRVTDSGLPS